MKNQKDVLVSVIIPVYNKRDYIERCVESLIQTTDFPYEIILIDDGSKDDSFFICEKLANTYDCVFAYSQENQGVSVARNVGMSYAVGTYIAFVDADDFVSENYWEQLREALEQEADWYLFRYTRCIGEKRMLGYMPLRSGYYEDMIPLRRAVAGLEICMLSVWTALYRRDLIQENYLQFRVGMKTCEDFLFNINYIRHISNYMVSDGSAYCYYMNTESVTAKRPLSHADDYAVVFDESKGYLEACEASNEEMSLFEQRWIRWLISLVFSWKEQKFCKKDIWEKLDGNRCLMTVIGCGAGSLQTRLESKMFALHMERAIWLYMKTMNWMKRLVHKSDL